MTVPPDLRPLVPRVWCIDLRAAEPNLLALEAETPRLSEDDRLRASRFADDGHRRGWMAAHIALRLVIEQAGGVSVRRASFAQTANGRPFLADAPFDFSLSHAARHALIGITGCAPIGVDVEGMREIRMEAGRRSAIESAGAALTSDALPSVSDTVRFLQAWVRLEALAKAEGTGMARVLSKAGAYGPRRGLAVDAQILPAGLRVMDLALGPDLFGAVALSSATVGLQVADMPVDIDGLRRFTSLRPD